MAAPAAAMGGGFRGEIKALQQQLKDSKKAHTQAVAPLQVCPHDSDPTNVCYTSVIHFHVPVKRVSMRVGFLLQSEISPTHSRRVWHVASACLSFHTSIIF